MLFENLNIILPIQRSLKDEGYTEATPIQAKTILPLLEGKDLLGCAQTGTGKTAAFAIPILQGLNAEPKSSTGNRQIKALVLAPTRELAIQIHESFETYGRYLSLKSIAIYGGVSQKAQTNSLSRGVDILVATPGRLNDLLSQKLVDLSNIEIFVLDEADRMLDMGFLNDVRKIIKYIPKKKQTLLFSATMAPEIKDIADDILVKPVGISVAPVSSAVETVEQSLFFVDKANKKNLLQHLLEDPSMESVLVFSRTKHGADKIVKDLLKADINAAAIHGNKSQGNRQLALSNFKNRVTRVLVATDIAARGIDIDELSHVVNHDLPNVPETYIHRIGRTGRAGLEGTAISFCDINEKPLLTDIEKLLKKKIAVVKENPFPMLITTPEKPQKTESRRSDKPLTLREKKQNPKNHAHSKRPAR